MTIFKITSCDMEVFAEDDLLVVRDRNNDSTVMLYPSQGYMLVRAIISVLEEMHEQQTPKNFK